MDPRAAAAFNDRAEALPALVRIRERETGSPGWFPQIRHKAEITDKDLTEEPDVGFAEPEGDWASMEFIHSDQTYELAGDSYLDLRRLVEMVAKNVAFRDSMSSRTIESVLRRWVRYRVRGQEQLSFSEQLVALHKELVVLHEVWIPIQRLHVQRPLHLGMGRIEEISKERLNGLVAAAPAHLQQHAEQELRQFQGHAAVVVECMAEPQRAMELALEQAEIFLAVLSLFGPGTLRCRMGSEVNLWGMQLRRTATALLFREGRLAKITQSGLEGNPPRFIINDEFWSIFKADLASASRLLKNATKGSLAEAVVDALRIYRRATLTSNPAEKLIFVFAGLESVLLSGTHEPIQDSVGVRLAFLIGQTADERKKIVETMREGYALRSSFIHHGAQVDDFKTADEFLQLAWRGMIALTHAAATHAKPRDLIDALEIRKLQ